MGRVWASTRADSNGKRVPDPLSPFHRDTYGEGRHPGWRIRAGESS